MERPRQNQVQSLQQLAKGSELLKSEDGVLEPSAALPALEEC